MHVVRDFGDGLEHVWGEILDGNGVSGMMQKRGKALLLKVREGRGDELVCGGI